MCYLCKRSISKVDICQDENDDDNPEIIDIKFQQCMTVRKQSVADHSRSSCEAASRQDTSLLPYGDMSSLLEHDNPAQVTLLFYIYFYDLYVLQACSVSCYTSSNLKVSRGWSFPDGTVCKVTGRSSDQLSFCIQV